jgi:hypothetical protein
VATLLRFAGRRKTESFDDFYRASRIDVPV